MSEQLHGLVEQLLATSIWEALAVAMGLAYLLLAMREKLLCWYAAFISTAVSIYVFWDVELLMESALQLYYLLMAVYGWYQWKYAGGAGKSLAIQRWRSVTHLGVISGVLVISAISGYLLDQHTEAAWPYLDSFTTWAAVLTTYMVAQKVLENWIYWLLIDGLSMFLYIDRGLYLYSLLFFVYLIIVIFGFIEWKRHYQAQDNCRALNPADVSL